MERVRSRVRVMERATSRIRVAAVQAVRATRLHGAALYRMLPPGTLIYGPPAYGAVPPVRSRATAALTAGIARGVPPKIVGGSAIGLEAGLTSGNGPTRARVPGGLRTAVAHAPSQLSGLPPLPSRNHSIMKHQRGPRCLFGSAGPTCYGQ
jgi:hypothetical protein